MKIRSQCCPPDPALPDFPGGSDGRVFLQGRRRGSDPGSGRSPEERVATRPGLGSPMDWGAWRAVVSGVTTSPALPKLLTLTSHTTSITGFVLLFFSPCCLLLPACSHPTRKTVLVLRDWRSSVRSDLRRTLRPRFATFCSFGRLARAAALASCLPPLRLSVLAAPFAAYILSRQLRMLALSRDSDQLPDLLRPSSGTCLQSLCLHSKEFSAISTLFYLL